MNDNLEISLGPIAKGFLAVCYTVTGITLLGIAGGITATIVKLTKKQ